MKTRTPMIPLCFRTSSKIGLLRLFWLRSPPSGRSYILNVIETKKRSVPCHWGIEDVKELRQIRQIRDRDIVVFSQNVIVFDATHGLKPTGMNEDRTKKRTTFNFSPPFDVRQQKKKRRSQIQRWWKLGEWNGGSGERLWRKEGYQERKNWSGRKGRALSPDDQSPQSMRESRRQS